MSDQEVSNYQREVLTVTTEVRERNVAHRERVQSLLEAAGFNKASLPLYRLDKTTDLIERLVIEERAKVGIFWRITLAEAIDIVGESNFSYWQVVEVETFTVLGTSTDGANSFWKLHDQAWIFIDEMNGLYKTPASELIVNLIVE